mgnify:FL=1
MQATPEQLRCVEDAAEVPQYQMDNAEVAQPGAQVDSAECQQVYSAECQQVDSAWTAEAAQTQTQTLKTQTDLTLNGINQDQSQSRRKRTMRWWIRMTWTETT